MKTRHHI